MVVVFAAVVDVAVTVVIIIIGVVVVLVFVVVVVVPARGPLFETHPLHFETPPLDVTCCVLMT